MQHSSQANLRVCQPRNALDSFASLQCMTLRVMYPFTTVRLSRQAWLQAVCPSFLPKQISHSLIVYIVMQARRPPCNPGNRIRQLRLLAMLGGIHSVFISSPQQNSLSPSHPGPHTSNGMMPWRLSNSLAPQSKAANPKPRMTLAGATGQVCKLGMKHGPVERQDALIRLLRMSKPATVSYSGGCWTLWALVSV